ncbi:unnamed protein product, partial [Darwinula stevensoni]
WYGTPFPRFSQIEAQWRIQGGDRPPMAREKTKIHQWKDSCAEGNSVADDRAKTWNPPMEGQIVMHDGDRQAPVGEISHSGRWWRIVIIMANKYNLKWNSHHAETFENFDILRSREMLVDITLSCGGQTIKAHKLVLCTGSAFFEKLLQRDNSKCPIVHFHGVDMLHLRLLVDFMYLGEVDVPSSDLEDFITLADSLEVKGLKGDKSKRFDLGEPIGKPGMSPSCRSQVINSAPFANLRPSDAPPKTSFASTSSRSASMKRRIPAGVDSASGVPDIMSLPSASPAANKRPRPESIVPDQTLGSDESQSGTVVKTENDEETGSAQEGDQSTYWAVEEGLSTAAAAYSHSSHEVEGGEELLDPNEVPPHIPPEIVPESITRGHDGVWSGIIMESKGKIYFCTFCSYQSPYKTSTLRHVQSRHTGEKPYECGLCGRKFIRRERLRNHMLTCHSTLVRETEGVWSGRRLGINCKLFFCSFCAHKSTSKSKAIVHLRQHTGEKPYKVYNLRGMLFGEDRLVSMVFGPTFVGTVLTRVSTGVTWTFISEVILGRNHFSVDCVERLSQLKVMPVPIFSCIKMASKYNLKWNSHHADTFSSFDVLRSREMLVDVTLSCGGQTMKAHKLVLCSGSALFEKLLQKDSSACPIIHFHSMEMMHLRLLVDFMYLGEVDVPSSDLEQFIALAESLEVKGLKADRSRRSNPPAEVGRPEMPSTAGKSWMASQGSLMSSLGAAVLPSTSGFSSTAPVKRKLSMAMSSGFRLQDAQHCPLSLPVSEKKSKSESIHADTSSQASDMVQSEDLVKTETEEIEEVDELEEGEDSYYGEEEEMRAFECDDDTSSYQVEGEEFDQNVLPANIPPEIAPESIQPVDRAVWRGQLGTGLWTYFCGICAYKTINRTYLDIHIRRHTGEKPFQCRLCGKAFSRKDSASTHIMGIHRSPAQDNIILLTKKV